MLRSKVRVLTPGSPLTLLLCDPNEEEGAGVSSSALFHRSGMPTVIVEKVTPRKASVPTEFPNFSLLYSHCGTWRWVSIFLGISHSSVLAIDKRECILRALSLRAWSLNIPQTSVSSSVNTAPACRGERRNGDS